MQFISYKNGEKSTFGAINSVNEIVDLGAHLGCENLAHALKQSSFDELKNLAINKSTDLNLNAITAYRAVVADPQGIFCVGLNYEEHRRETKRTATANPTVFLRLPNSQIGHQQPIICPLESDCLDYEGEIAIVIGLGGRRIKAEHAWHHIAGMSAYNDASVRDWQGHSTQWTQGKNFMSTGAFGPTLVTTDEIRENENLVLETFLNGNLMQSASTDMMLFSISELIAYISSFTVLTPGDVIVTGTPGGVGFKKEPPLYMKDGDEVTIQVSKIGCLTNTIFKEIEKF
ncbi:fumarylacetoacetate hydrolase family protein [Advenella sp. WQ 585]|uniref:Fumarylacetoacetate hydrolase family protein n=1 Tax=Advenella mandrilli TaxID=2800330 RepID=A0ABS1EHG6_9BURK|nr:fumarylacetoacetate hydrolase family protein [Advenella mandrilli]MBK1782467.1 fumarylacetoacetate hydrolase family protein [Advenella mandrilli]